MKPLAGRFNIPFGWPTPTRSAAPRTCWPFSETGSASPKPSLNKNAYPLPIHGDPQSDTTAKDMQLAIGSTSKYKHLELKLLALPE